MLILFGNDLMSSIKTEQNWIRRLKDVESLYLTPEAACEATAEYFACVYIEARIDFNDIRTGYKGATKLARALKIHEDNAIPGWSEEIIQDAHTDRINEITPPAAQLCPPPEFLDAEFVDIVKNRYFEYLTRSWKKILYRNSELNIYSGTGESREEFVARCRELFLERMSEELDDLRMIINRMQERLKEKYLSAVEMKSPGSTPLTPKAKNRIVYSRYAERIDALFMKAASWGADAAADVPLMDKHSELEERLIALTVEARQRVVLLRESYEKKTELIDEYILRPNLKNIRCERSCILWMPREAEDTPSPVKNTPDLQGVSPSCEADEPPSGKTAQGSGSNAGRQKKRKGGAAGKGM